MVDVSRDDCVDNGSIVTRAHDTAGCAPYGYTHWRSIWPVKQILNYQLRSDVSQNAIICIRQIKNLCDIYHVSISVVDENINEDVFSKQCTCSLLDFLFPSTLVSRVRRTCTYGACCPRDIQLLFDWYISAMGVANLDCDIIS